MALGLFEQKQSIIKTAYMAQGLCEQKQSIIRTAYRAQQLRVETEDQSSGRRWGFLSCNRGLKEQGGAGAL